MSFLRRLEKKIDELMRDPFRAPAAGGDRVEIIEIQRAILDDIGDRIQLLPRARKAFPFNDVSVRIAAPDPDRRTALDMVFVQNNSLAQDIREYLEQEGAEVARDLKVNVLLVDAAASEFGGKAYLLTCANRDQPAGEMPGQQPATPRLRLTVTHGQVEQDAVEVEKPRIHLGRLSEILDDFMRPVRRNDVAFTDSTEPPNSTVSRAHAHIEFRDGEFRLFDDNSAFGTSVIHEGRLLSVPPGGRGIKLASGDEIYLGQARIRIEFA